MKLLQQTGLYFMGLSFLALLISGIAVFYVLQFTLDQELDESLIQTRPILLQELSKRDSLPPVVEIMDEIIDIQEVNSLSKREEFRDTLRLIPEIEDGAIILEEEPFRQYIYTEEIEGKVYRIGLNRSKIEREQLFTLIISLVAGVLFLYFLILNLFNRFLSQKIWRPFNHTINQIRQFSFANPERLHPLPTQIEEFNTLAEAIQLMTSKLTQDYHSLKKFSENASHEIQTPLAIIKSQTDLLVQQEHSETNLKYIQQIQRSANKISRLNKSLILLTRIENHQFEVQESLQLDRVIEERLDAMDILTVGKSIGIKKKLVPVRVNANLNLLDILVSNLLSNAIHHNIQNGTIELSLTNKGLTVRNTGLPNHKNTDELFERFQKSDESGTSVGLGLAIVKEICNLYQWTIDYQIEGQWHVVAVEFSP